VIVGLAPTTNRARKGPVFLYRRTLFAEQTIFLRRVARSPALVGCFRGITLVF
jgi:hypothetical protein